LFHVTELPARLLNVISTQVPARAWKKCTKEHTKSSVMLESHRMSFFHVGHTGTLYRHRIKANL
jgi:hypothetical protein